MRYPVVLLDVGETLIGPRQSFGAVYAEVLSELGLTLPHDRLERSIRQTVAEMNERIPQGQDRYRHFDGGERAYWLRFVTRVLERAGAAATEADVAERALDALGATFREKTAWRLYDDTLPTLQELQRMGIRLGVVSNWDSNLPRVLDLLELTPFFEVVGVSHLEGCEKPDPSFFKTVLDRMQARPEDAVHVGDSAVHDGDGATAAGIVPILIDRSGSGTSQHRSIRSLSALPQIVAG